MLVGGVIYPYGTREKAMSMNTATEKQMEKTMEI